MDKQNIYISYAWKDREQEIADSREEIVDKLCEAFEKQGYHVMRDKVDMTYRDTIRDFMQDIASAKVLIAVISKKYLNSRFCMYELTEAWNKKGFENRIFPIVLEDAEYIYGDFEQLDLVKHWEAEFEKYETKLKSIKNDDAKEGFTSILRDLKSIYSRISGAIKVVSGKVGAGSQKLLIQNNFDQIIDQVENELINETQTPKPQTQTPNTPKPPQEPQQEYAPKSPPLFTGRVVELAKIKTTFESNKIFSLTGIGGIGKTSLMARFIETLETEVQKKVIWFSFTGDKTFDSFIESSPFSAIREGNKTDKDKFSALLSKSNENKSIIVWEDFHTHTHRSFDDFLQFAKDRLGDAKLIIISRKRMGTIKDIEITELSEIFDYAKKLTKDFYSNLNLDDEQIGKICNYVNGHPLALEFALSLCQSNSLDRIINKLSKYKARGDELSKRLFEDILAQDSTTEEEKNFLYQFSIFKEATSDTMLEALFGEDIFYETIPNLKAKHLISFSQEQQQYSTHPLIREFCYAKLDKQNKKELHQKAADFLQARRGKKLKLEAEERVFYHLQGAENTQEIANLIQKQGKNYQRQAFYELLEKSFNFLNKRNIHSPLQDIIQGDIFKIKGDKNKALACFEKAKNNKENEELALEALLKIGDIYQLKGDKESALKTYQEAEKIAKDKGFEKYTAWAYNNIANIKQKTYKQYDEALKLKLKALEISERLNIKEDIASLYQNIGGIYYQKDFKGYNLATALDYYQKSLKISLEIEDKEGIANSYGHIGNIYQNPDFKKPNLSIALDYHQKSLKISLEIEHKEGIARSYNNIGYIYQNPNFKKPDLNIALDYHQKSFKISLAIEDKEGIARSYHGIGYVYNEKKEYKTSLINYFQAYVGFKQVESSDLQTTKANIIILKRELGREKFLNHARQALAELSQELKEQINLDDFLELPRKSAKKHKRNDIVKARYKNGVEKEGKYKKFERDIESGKCELLD